MEHTPQAGTVVDLTEGCDRCGVAAKVRIDLAGSGKLAFCGHHANQYAKLILSTAAQIAVLDGFDWSGWSQARAATTG
jgi:hypothetical protein